MSEEREHACHFNRECWQFFAQLMFSLFLMAFAVGMVVKSPNDKLEIYLPIITGVAATWAPNPQMPKVKPKVAS